MAQNKSGGPILDPRPNEEGDYWPPKGTTYTQPMLPQVRANADGKAWEFIPEEAGKGSGARLKQASDKRR